MSTGAPPTVWTIHIGNSFFDVPTTDLFYGYVERLLHMGVTAGCGLGNFCPSSPVSRAEMAVFLLKAEHGPAYVPPNCSGVFDDVPCPGPYADWIEQLYHEGITGGCAVTPLRYCPDDPVTRAPMAAFILKTKHGSSYVPPTCIGLFKDVPCPGPFADWIEQLYREGTTAGCGGDNYCPAAPNTRGQMAAFLVKAFGPPAPHLPTPTPTPVSPTPIITSPPGTTPTPTPTANPNRIVYVGQGGNNFVDSLQGNSTTTIVVGQAVEFDWVTGPHSTTSGVCNPNCTPDGTWDSGIQSPAYSFIVYLGVGSFHYYCQVHQGTMTGVIYVLPGGLPDSPGGVGVRGPRPVARPRRP